MFTSQPDVVITGTAGYIGCTLLWNEFHRRGYRGIEADIEVVAKNSPGRFNNSSGSKGIGVTNIINRLASCDTPRTCLTLGFLERDTVMSAMPGKSKNLFPALLDACHYRC